LALGAAGAVAIGIVTLYGAWISRKLSGKSQMQAIAQWVAVPLVAFYCGYAVLYLARANAKTDAVRSAYMATHPVLRMALSTIILVDGDLMVTDLARTPEDYRKMGLSVREASLHFRQRDGWVHAVDLRTSGRGMIRNVLIRLYFVAMGFDTIRHGGTGEHLHVSLEPR
jgi:phosphate/sulfate permease